MEIQFTKKNKNNVADAIEGKKSYKELTTTEWHQFVQNYNYDDGNEPFEWLIKQKVCDRGTALCLYWYLDPIFFYDPKNTNVLKNNLSLIKEIEQLYANGFYESELFSFDPKTEYSISKNEELLIPKMMIEKTNGIPFERVSVEFAFLRKPDEKEQKAIDKKIKDAISIILKSNPEYKPKSVDENIIEIINCVEYWKGKDIGKIKINNLSYLWLDCLCKKYNWTWVIWDWETGKHIGAINKEKTLACLSDTIIIHTFSNFQPSSIISSLFNDLDKANSMLDVKNKLYGGIGLLFSTNHLKFIE